MAQEGNKYADKVFSEHPIALWPLDEKAFYISQITDNDRNFNNWTRGSVEDRVNLISNPSFETNATGWSAVGTGSSGSINTTHQYIGSQSYALTVGTVNSYVQISTNIPVIAGQVYTLSSYLKLIGGTSSGGVYIEVVWRDSTGAVISLNNNSGTQTVNSSSWTRHSVTATAPSNAAYAQIRPLIAQVASNPAGTQIALDAILFEQSSSAQSYFDGAVNGGAWIGTPHASQSVIHGKDRINLITNPSFETGITGWNPDSLVTLAQSGTQFLYGTKGMTMTATGAGATYCSTFSSRATVTPNKIYTASSYVKRIVGTSTYAILLRFWDSSNNYITQYDSTTYGRTLTTTGTWTRLSVSAPAPSNAATADIIIISWAGALNDQIAIDGSLLEESIIAYPYFDGSFTAVDYNGTTYSVVGGTIESGTIGWSGTAHASTSFMKQWTPATTSIPSLSSPFDDDYYSTFRKSVAIGGTMELVSPDLFNVFDISSNIPTFTINTFIHAKVAYFNWIKYGIRYNNALGVPQEIISNEITSPSSEAWINLNQTYAVPESLSGSIKFFVQINIDDTSSDSTQRRFTMNGFSVGQDSSTTCYDSLGIEPVALPAALNLSLFSGYPADTYGLSSENGYYLIRNNYLLAKNDGLPLIYGTDHSTKIYNSIYGFPSLIFPGKGMLHEEGRNKYYTFEMWMKADPLTTKSEKILGPLDSTDGLYVKEGFLTLVIGDEIGTHCVADWYRPMLIHICLKEANATLMMNGEEVLSIPFDRKNVELSNLRDWWGVYSYDTMGSFSVDTISIFPYIVSGAVAKRRFVYGLGTPDAQTIDKSFYGVSTEIEFSTSEYNNSIIYPDMGRWDAGYFNNLVASKDYLSVPTYSLPTINIGGRDIQEWYDNNLIANSLDNPYLINRRDSALSKWICMVSTTVTYAMIDSGISIYEINSTQQVSTVVTSTGPVRGTFSAVAGRTYFSDGPVSMVAEGNNSAIVPVTMYSRSFVGNVARNNPATIYIYPLWEDATVSFYDNNVVGGITGTPTSTINIKKGTIETISVPNIGYYFISSTADIVATQTGTAGVDQTILSPPSTTVYNKYVTFPRTVNNTAPSTIGSYVVSDSIPLMNIAYADGSGSAMSQSRGKEFLSDRYAFGNVLSDYVIVVPNTNTITVSYWNGVTWSVFENHNIVGGTELNPIYVARDGNNGAGVPGTTLSGVAANLASGATLWKFEGSDVFYLNINDSVDDEQSVCGWINSHAIASQTANFITFRPNINYTSTNIARTWDSDGINYNEISYLNFDSLNILNDGVAAIYGVFKTDRRINSARPLIHFVNIINGSKFDIFIINDEVVYSINDEELYSEVVDIANPFVVGINFDFAAINFGYEVSNFFSSPSSIQTFIGGDGVDTFEGKIFSVGFMNDSNHSLVAQYFYDPGDLGGGLINSTFYDIMIDHISSYTLIPEIEYQHLFLDISVSSDWQEYFPLSYFASYVKDENGELVYDLDMLQVNMSYTSVISTKIWDYYEVQQSYLTYESLNTGIGPFSNYFALEQKNTTGGSIDVSDSAIQTYITFQKITDGANSPISEFPYGKTLTENLVIDADAENTVSIPDKSYKTVYAFRDNTVVLPPTYYPFEEYAMVIHLIINQRSTLKNPLKIKRLEISSKNFNYNDSEFSSSSRTAVGTKFGKKIYPQSDVYGGVVDYKWKNPYTLYKASTPYLYTTKYSGVRVAQETLFGSPYPLQNQVLIPINESNASVYKISAVQLMLKPDFFEATESIKLFDINHRDGTLTFVANKQEDFANISVYSRTNALLLDGGSPSTPSYVGEFDGGLSYSYYNQYMNINTGMSTIVSPSVNEYSQVFGSEFYQNGRFVSEVILRNGEWTSVGISLPFELSFDEYPDGGIAVFGGFVFNNISYYQSEGLGIDFNVLGRTWTGVLTDQVPNYPAPPNLWTYWDESDWTYAYVLGTSLVFSSTPEDIFNAYMGTNSIIVDDNNKIDMKQREVKLITDAKWSSFIEKPA